MCKLGLNGTAVIKTISTFAILVLAFSFGIFKWSHTDLETIRRKIRTILTRQHYHHPEAAVEKTGRRIIDTYIANLRDCQVMKMSSRKCMVSSQK